MKFFFTKLKENFDIFLGDIQTESKNLTITLESLFKP